MQQIAFTNQKADTFCQLLRAGKRVGYAANHIGVSRGIAYIWKSKYPDFAKQWNESAIAANEAMEQVVYDHGINGDMAAAFWWLRNHKPETYNRELLIKWALAQVQLANGCSLELDDNGLLKSGGKSNVRRVVILPPNGRDNPPEPKQDDSTQLALPLPEPSRTPSHPFSYEEQLARQLQLQEQAKPVPELPASEAEILPPERESSVVPFPDDPNFRRWRALAS